MTREQYESLPLAQLKAIAKTRGMKGTSTLKKGELITLMLEKDCLLYTSKRNHVFMKRVLKTVIVASVIALALILAKNEYARLLPASTYGIQAAIRKECVDNLFIGSSMFRQGLDIDVLEEKLPGSSYILSYNCLLYTSFRGRCCSCFSFRPSV